MKVNVAVCDIVVAKSRHSGSAEFTLHCSGPMFQLDFRK